MLLIKNHAENEDDDDAIENNKDDDLIDNDLDQK